VNKNTIVVVQSVGPINLETFVTSSNGRFCLCFTALSHIHLPAVTAVVWSGLAGQEAGNSLVDILYGIVNPSGRLPYTIGKSINDYAATVVYSGSNPQIAYSECLNIDYRHFDSAGITPRYEFGFGLSYTTFSYSTLSVTGAVGSYTPPSGPGSSLDSRFGPQLCPMITTQQRFQPSCQRFHSLLHPHKQWHTSGP
jgi:beta-glucosidase